MKLPILTTALVACSITGALASQQETPAPMAQEPVGTAPMATPPETGATPTEKPAEEHKKKHKHKRKKHHRKHHHHHHKGTSSDGLGPHGNVEEVPGQRIPYTGGMHHEKSGEMKSEMHGQMEVPGKVTP